MSFEILARTTTTTYARPRGSSSLICGGLTTVAQYVTSFQRAYIDANELGCRISPYCGLLEILRELKSDLPYWVATVLFLLPEDAVTDYTDADLFKSCRMAIEQDDILNQRNFMVARGG